MDWVDALLVNAFAAFVVLSILVFLWPSLRRRVTWRGVGAAWLAAFLTALVIAVTHPNAWDLSCPQLPAGPRVFFPRDVPCSGNSSLPLWISELPMLIGIAVLLVWVLRTTRPVGAALRTCAVLIAVTAGIVALGQFNPNVALLVVVLMAVGAFVWARREAERRPLSA
jgi:hypothetical protein